MTRISIISGVLLLFILLAFTACGPVKNEDTPDGLTNLASAAMDSGNMSDALRYYRMAIDKFPDDVLMSRWQLGRGRALLALGRLEEAEEAAEAAGRTARDPSGKAGAGLLQSEILFQRGSFRNGIEVLSEINREHLSGEDSESAVELLRSALKKTDLDFLTEEPSDDWTRLFFLLELEERYVAQGDIDKAVLTGMEIDRHFPEAHERYGRPSIPEGTDGFVAMVLPFSGDAGGYAEKVKTGIELAFDRSSQLFSSSPDLMAFDCSGDSAGIESIMNSLGINPACLAVIGPLTSTSAKLAAPLAQQWSLPMLTPTATSSELDSYGEYVHRLVVSQGDDAAAVAEYAVRRAGCSRIAIIHEFTSESVSSAEQFSSVVRELGAEIVAMEGYETGATDFRDQINAIRYLAPDGVFLPVKAWDAIQLAPQLRFYRVDANLFGTSGWDDEILLEQGGEYVEGAVFPVSFGSGSMNPATARFSYFYQREYDTLPGILAAQGYDAASIVLDGWENSRPSRSALEDHLQNLNIYFGATGMCTLGNVSISRSAFPLVTVSDGEIINIE